MPRLITTMFRLARGGFSGSRVAFTVALMVYLTVNNSAFSEELSASTFEQPDNPQFEFPNCAKATQGNPATELAMCTERYHNSSAIPRFGSNDHFIEVCCAIGEFKQCILQSLSKLCPNKTDQDQAAAHLLFNYKNFPPLFNGSIDRTVTCPEYLTHFFTCFEAATVHLVMNIVGGLFLIACIATVVVSVWRRLVHGCKVNYPVSSLNSAFTFSNPTSSFYLGRSLNTTTSASGVATFTVQEDGQEVCSVNTPAKQSSDVETAFSDSDQSTSADNVKPGSVSARVSFYESKYSQARNDVRFENSYLSYLKEANTHNAFKRQLGVVSARALPQVTESEV